MYNQRHIKDLSELARLLAISGFAVTEDVYSIAEVSKINSVVSGLFSHKSSEKRSYVRPDEMVEHGILDWVLSRRMKDLLRSIVPDPVLYHLHFYEIAGLSEKSHIFSEKPGGWHRDPDSEYFPPDPTHVSVFVYLTDVGPDDGPFEFCPSEPTSKMSSKSPIISMAAPLGTTFAWNRSYYHRAAPNRGPNRRRLLKISIQPNAFESRHLKESFFANAIAKIPAGDDELDMLLGRFQGRTAPTLPPVNIKNVHSVYADRTPNLDADALLQMKLADSAEPPESVPYD